MEVGTEISQKIRSAIKAKLMELGAYVDDELPDYIMVMVANKKNKSQMRTDLSLFLGANTDAFTTWLHSLLGKLQTITIETTKEKSDKHKDKGSKEKKKDKTKEAKKGERDKTKRKKRKSSQSLTDDAPKVKVASIEKAEKDESGEAEVSQATKGQVDQEAGETIESLETSKEVDNGNNNMSSTSNSKDNQEEVEDVRQLLVSVTPGDGDDLAQELDAVEEEVTKPRDVVKQKASKSKEKKNIEPSTKITISENVSSALSTTQPTRKRKVPSSVVASINRDDDDEYDPLNPVVGSVASVVKVTSRKPSYPTSMQANRALLVKAMSEAEKSVSVKRKVAMTRPTNRKSSPAEYSPKRKNVPGRETERASPPPYIPSRKGPAKAVSSSLAKGIALSKDDVRHMLGDRGDGSGLRSASGRQELFSVQKNDRNASPLSKICLSNNAKVKDSDVDRGTVAYTREVKGESGEDTEVKNLQIIARVGPISSKHSTHSSRDRESSLEDSPENKSPLRVTILSSSSSKKLIPANADQQFKYDSASRKSLQGRVDRPSMLTEQDARENIQAARRNKITAGPDATLKSSRGARVISKLAREAVQKQCKAAVLSVKKAPTRQIESRESPDSRVVHCESRSPSHESVLIRSDLDDKDKKARLSDDGVESEGVASTDSDKVIVIETKLKPRKSSTDHLRVKSRDSDAPVVRSEKLEKKKEGSVKLDTEEVEDLSQMLENEDEEDLDSQLLLTEESNEFTLDLDDEDLSHVVDEVAAEEENGARKAEAEDSNKAGIRFIVTLDGVDEAQFEGATPSKPAPAPVQPNPAMAGVLPIPQVAMLSPTPSQPLVPISGLGSGTLPPAFQLVPQQQASATPLTSTPAAQQESSISIKPRPPKIQPFSISLRDSDDEHEEKIITYVQAGDIRAANHNINMTATTLGDNSAGEELSALDQARRQERCRFWPACAIGSECPYHHPTTHCKTFPNCKFGDKCLFIHPNCRFDSKCTRSDCPYTHTSKRRISQLAVPAPPIPPPPRFYQPRYPTIPHYHQVSATTSQVCHFFPNCLKPSCPFLHPKPCMYGPACKNPTCTFYHPVSQVSTPATAVPLPDKAKLKWQAPQVVNKITTAPMGKPATAPASSQPAS